MRAEDIRQLIVQHLPCTHIEVNGDDGRHFEALVVSETFVGKSMVQQHQQVYQALGTRMREEIHALSMRTYTPEQWSQVAR